MVRAQAWARCCVVLFYFNWKQCNIMQSKPFRFKKKKNPSHVKSPYNLLENCIKFLEISDWEVICEHVQINHLSAKQC